MNLLGMGPGELILIAALGLIVFGPGKLPEIAAQLGKMVRDFRQSTTDISAEFRRSFDLTGALDSADSADAWNVDSPTASAQPTIEPAPPPVEPPVADTSDWHWETGGTTPPVVASEATPPTVSQ